MYFSIIVPGPGTVFASVCTYILHTLTHIQIYCPLDGPEYAFHRCLYVFCCKTSKCTESGRYFVIVEAYSFINCSSVVCMRSQLPKTNPYYPTAPEEKDYQDSLLHLPSLCELCGYSISILFVITYDLSHSMS